jgi:hypothetical protein
MLSHLIFAPLIFLIACVFACAGLGGGSAYLSVLSFWTSDPSVLRPLGWTLNVAVSAAALIRPAGDEKLDQRLAWPLGGGGVIGSSLTAAMTVGARPFQLLLAVALVYASFRMLSRGKEEASEPARQPLMVPAILMGAAVGALSGLIGVGGGIIMGALLLSLKWTEAKKLAPLGAVYILFTSAAALASYHLDGGRPDLKMLGAFGGVALIGGLIGRKWGAGKASESLLRNVFGLAAAAAGIKLVLEYFRII